MQIDITIKNYRCFPDSKPVQLSLRNGFTSLVGINNSGKTSLLRFFFEFRELFRVLSGESGNFLDVARGKRLTFGFPKSISDMEEVFCNANDRNLEVQVEIVDANVPQIAKQKISIVVFRGTNQLQSKFLFPSITDSQLQHLPLKFL